MIYKVKHVPSGLYYQPHKHRGSNLSKRGKVYQTGTHGLSSAIKYAEWHKDKPQHQLFYVYAHKDTTIYKEFKDRFNWEESFNHNELKAATNLTDWIVEPVGNIEPSAGYCDCAIKLEVCDNTGCHCTFCGKPIRQEWKIKMLQEKIL